MSLRIDIRSFAFRKGLPEELNPLDGLYVFDCRILPDPYNEGNLRQFSGRDEAVKAFFTAHADEVRPFLASAEAVVTHAIADADAADWDTIVVLFGCSGGHHRSVYCAEWLAERLRSLPEVEVSVTHTNLVGR